MLAIIVYRSAVVGILMQYASHQISSPESRRASVAPAVLLVASLLEVLGMLHHPSIHSANVAEAVDQIARLSNASAVVHGALITLMLLIVYGFVDFAVRVGWERPLVRAGAIAYGCGVLVMVGAGLVSGFIITGLTALVPHVTAVDLQINFQLLLLCRVLNQACANFAVVAMSTGILLWSLELCRHTGWPRTVGLFGCLVAAMPAIAIINGSLELDVHGMTEVVAVQAAWNMAVALLMLGRDLDAHTPLTDS